MKTSSQTQSSWDDDQSQLMTILETASASVLNHLGNRFVVEYFGLRDGKHKPTWLIAQESGLSIARVKLVIAIALEQMLRKGIADLAGGPRLAPCRVLLLHLDRSIRPDENGAEMRLYRLLRNELPHLIPTGKGVELLGYLLDGPGGVEKWRPLLVALNDNDKREWDEDEEAEEQQSEDWKDSQDEDLDDPEDGEVYSLDTAVPDEYPSEHWQTVLSGNVDSSHYTSWDSRATPDELIDSLPGLRVAQPAGSGADPVQSDFDVELYEKLRVLRRNMQGPDEYPFQVFSNRTLREIVEHLPRTESEFLAINGIGQYKLEKYGPRFIKLINEYCSEKEVSLGLDNFEVAAQYQPDEIETQSATSSTKGWDDDGWADGWDDKGNVVNKEADHDACYEPVTPLESAIDWDLFDKLRNVRGEIATERGFPAYMVFRDRTLEEMATYFPHTETQFAQMWGVGQRSVDRYAEHFLPVIRIHCEERGILPRPKHKHW